MILGFTTGELKPISIESKIEKYKELGCRAIELGLVDVGINERWLAVKKITPKQLEGFDHVSVHAPGGSFVYKKDKTTFAILDKLQILYDKFQFRHAIIHPDRVEDWSVFDKYSFSIATENMDSRKPIGKSVNSLKKIFDKVDCKLVLDINHSYVNDKSLALVGEFYNAFKDRITEIHLSGYETLHDPLFKTKQIEIIKAIPDKNLPIIIESMQSSLDDIESEYNYIRNVLDES